MLIRSERFVITSLLIFQDIKTKIKKSRTFDTIDREERERSL